MAVETNGRLLPGTDGQILAERRMDPRSFRIEQTIKANPNGFALPMAA